MKYNFIDFHVLNFFYVFKIYLKGILSSIAILMMPCST